MSIKGIILAVASAAIAAAMPLTANAAAAVRLRITSSKASSKSWLQGHQDDSRMRLSSAEQMYVGIRPTG
jgi:hypothetical protein